MENLNGTNCRKDKNKKKKKMKKTRKKEKYKKRKRRKKNKEMEEDEKMRYMKKNMNLSFDYTTSILHFISIQQYLPLTRPLYPKTQGRMINTNIAFSWMLLR